MTKIWLTYPYCDVGVVEAHMGKPDKYGWRDMTGGHGSFPWRVFGWEHEEGRLWHRSRKAALTVAEKHRADRIAKAASEAARLSSLPPIRPAA